MTKQCNESVNIHMGLGRQKKTCNGLGFHFSIYIYYFPLHWYSHLTHPYWKTKSDTTVRLENLLWHSLYQRYLNFAVGLNESHQFTLTWVIPTCLWQYNINIHAVSSLAPWDNFKISITKPETVLCTLF